MTTAAWLGILVTVVLAGLGVAKVWGGFTNELGNFKMEIAALKASRDKHGERLGQLDTRLQLLKQATSARGVTVARAEGET